MRFSFYLVNMFGCQINWTLQFFGWKNRWSQHINKADAWAGHILWQIYPGIPIKSITFYCSIDQFSGTIDQTINVPQEGGKHIFLAAISSKSLSSSLKLQSSFLLWHEGRQRLGIVLVCLVSLIGFNRFWLVLSSVSRQPCNLRWDIFSGQICRCRGSRVGHMVPGYLSLSPRCGNFSRVSFQHTWNQHQNQKCPQCAATNLDEARFTWQGLRLASKSKWVGEPDKLLPAQPSNTILYLSSAVVPIFSALTLSKILLTLFSKVWF